MQINILIWGKPANPISNYNSSIIPKSIDDAYTGKHEHTELLQTPSVLILRMSLWMFFPNWLAFGNSSIDLQKYFQTSKAHMTWIIQKVNRIPTHCGVAYEGFYSLARSHVTLDLPTFTQRLQVYMKFSPHVVSSAQLYCHACPEDYQEDVVGLKSIWGCRYVANKNYCMTICGSTLIF